MRKMYKIVCVLFITLLSISSCVKDDIGKSSTENDNGSLVELTIEEAKSFFEENLQNAPTTRVNQKRQGLDVDFAPKWADAKIKSSENKAFVTAPISSPVQLEARYVVKKNGGSWLYNVKIYQKMIVVKDADGSMMTYLMTLLPDKDYYLSQRGKTKPSSIVNGGDKGDFTGMIFYTLPGGNFPVRMDSYVDGNLVNGASILNEMKGVDGEISSMISSLKNIRYRQISSASTRFWGSENNNDDYGDYYGGGSSSDGGGSSSDGGGGYGGGSSSSSDNSDGNWDYGTSGGYDYVGKIGGYEFWVVTNDSGYTTLIYDSNGDGKPDTAWVNQVTENEDAPSGNIDFPWDWSSDWPPMPDPGDYIGGGSPVGGGGSYGGSGGSSSGSSGSVWTPPAKQIPIVGLQVNIHPELAYLGDDIIVYVNPCPADATQIVENVKYYIYNEGSDNEYTLSNDNVGLMFNFKAKLPGRFYVCVSANVTETGETVYGENMLDIRFPDVDELLYHFESQMDNMWKRSKEAGTKFITYEYAANLVVDTRDHAKEMWVFEEYEPIGYMYDAEEMKAPFEETDEIHVKDFRYGGRWIVGIVHTHPSWHNAPKKRKVGPSDKDLPPSNGIPAWVYDYEPDKSGYITPEKALTAGFKRTSYGGDGRYEE